VLRFMVFSPLSGYNRRPGWVWYFQPMGHANTINPREHALHSWAVGPWGAGNPCMLQLRVMYSFGYHIDGWNPRTECPGNVGNSYRIACL